jgi:hypothetical protein
MFFLEHLIPHISALYFKSVFQEACLALGEKENVQVILMSFVRLVPEMRKRLDHSSAIERLEVSCLKRVIEGHTQKHISKELIELARS